MRVYLSEELAQLEVKFTAPKPGDAGYDLYAIETVSIMPGNRALIRTGVYLEIPEHHVGLVLDRSSMAVAGLHTMGGVIDSSYRGEVKVILLNTNTVEYTVKLGQKIAQVVVMPCYTQPVTAVENLSDLSTTERGSSGFGSTGL